MKNFIVIFVIFTALFSCDDYNTSKKSATENVPDCETKHENDPYIVSDYDVSFDQEMTVHSKDSEGVVHKKTRYEDRRFVIQKKNNSYVLLVYKKSKLIQKHSNLVMTGHKSYSKKICNYIGGNRESNILINIYLKDKSGKQIFHVQEYTLSYGYPTKYFAKYDRHGNEQRYETMNKEMMKPLKFNLN